MPPLEFTRVRDPTSEHPSAVTLMSVEYPVGIGRVKMRSKIPGLFGLPPIVSCPLNFESGDRH